MTRSSSSRPRPRYLRAFLPAALCLFGAWLTAAGAPPAVLVAIVPFENRSGVEAMVQNSTAPGNDAAHPKKSSLVDEYTASSRDALEGLLREIPGIQVADPRRVDAALAGPGFAPPISPDNAAKLGALLGARTVVTGAILDVRNSSGRIIDEGEVIEKSEVHAEVRVQIIDVAGGSVIFTKILKVSRTFPPGNFGGLQNPGVARTVVRTALEALSADEQFRMKLRP